MPAMVMVRVSWARDGEIPKNSASSGRAGRYMSVASGATAVMRPRKIKRPISDIFIQTSMKYKRPAAPQKKPPNAKQR